MMKKLEAKYAALQVVPVIDKLGNPKVLICCSTNKKKKKIKHYFLGAFVLAGAGGWGLETIFSLLRAENQIK